MSFLINDIIEKSCSAYPDLPAVRWLCGKEQEERTYAQLHSSILLVHKYLQRRNYRHVAIIGPSSYEWIVSYFGIVRGKRVAIPLDNSLPDEELLSLLVRSDTDAVFLTEKRSALLPLIQANCPNVKEILFLEKQKETNAAIFLYNNEKEQELSLPSPDDTATIIYTSGTTGLSKGVMLTQRNLYDNVQNVYFDTQPGTRMLSVLPIHHAYCLVMDYLKGFSLGATLCINDSLLHLMRNIALFQPDAILMVPLMIETICKKISLQGDAVKDPAALKMIFGANLKYIFSGGASLDPNYIKTLNALGIAVYQGYGMSECSPVIATNGQIFNRIGSVGKVLPNMNVRIENGEILVQGSSVMKGYYKMPEKTAETITDGWLHTGDLGRIDDDGYLFITGRIKNLIILSNGENVSPEEIENALLQKSALIGEIVISGGKNGLTAHIYPDSDFTARKLMTPEDIKEQLQTLLNEYNRSQPSYRAITKLVVRDIPFVKNTTQKIKRDLVY